MTGDMALRIISMDRETISQEKKTGDAAAATYHFFSKCPIYIKYMTEMKGQPYSYGTKDKDTKRNATGKKTGKLQQLID